MHDTIKYPDNLLVRVSAHRKAFVLRQRGDARLRPCDPACGVAGVAVGAV